MMPGMMGADPSPEEMEELLQLIERYERSTKGFGEVPEELRVRWQQQQRARILLLLVLLALSLMHAHGSPPCSRSWTT